MTLSLATRNLLRNRRRSMATLLALAIGATSVLLFGGYSADIQYSLLTGYVQTGGHLQIQHRDFFLYGNGNPTAYGIADYQRLIDLLFGNPSARKKPASTVLRSSTQSSTSPAATSFIGSRHLALNADALTIRSAILLTMIRPWSKQGPMGCGRSRQAKGHDEGSPPLPGGACRRHTSLPHDARS